MTLICEQVAALIFPSSCTEWINMNANRQNVVNFTWIGLKCSRYIRVEIMEAVKWIHICQQSKVVDLIRNLFERGFKDFKLKASLQCSNLMYLKYSVLNAIFVKACGAKSLPNRFRFVVVIWNLLKEVIFLKFC